MTQQQVYEWIARPELLNRDTLYELRTLLARYPYFQTARLLYLKNLYLLHDASFGEELRKAALYVADRRVLFYLIEGDRFTLTPLKKQAEAAEQPGLDRTLSLIDAFLSSQTDETERLHLPPADVAVDYTSYLLREENADAPSEAAPKLKGQSLIDDFIESADEAPLLSKPNVKKSETLPEEGGKEAEETEKEADGTEKVPEGEDESYFTETLAKIYVKQQRYSKALEIIKKLYLNYPKKNAYFADQIRFLEKLIINTKSE